MGGRAVQKISDVKYQIGPYSVEWQTKIIGSHYIEGEGKREKMRAISNRLELNFCPLFYHNPGDLYRIM